MDEYDSNFEAGGRLFPRSAAFHEMRSINLKFVVTKFRRIGISVESSRILRTRLARGESQGIRVLPWAYFFFSPPSALLSRTQYACRTPLSSTKFLTLCEGLEGVVCVCVCVFREGVRQRGGYSMSAEGEEMKS